MQARASLHTGSPKKPRVRIPFRLGTRKTTFFQPLNPDEASNFLTNQENQSQEGSYQNGEMALADTEIEKLPDPDLLYEEGFRLWMGGVDYKIVFFHNDQTEFLFVFEGIEDER